MGATHIHCRGTFPQQYALFSGQQYLSTGNVDGIVEAIYDTEMVQLKNDRNFMGMWQLWATSNVIGRPIRSMFSHIEVVMFLGQISIGCVCLLNKDVGTMYSFKYYVDSYEGKLWILYTLYPF